MSVSGGKKIQILRKARGLTQKQLAEKVHLATGTIQQYELGKRQPSTQTIEKIAEALSVSPFDLIGDGDPVSVHWVNMGGESKEAKAISEAISKKIKEGSPLKKLSVSEAYQAGFVRFHSEDDRLDFFYNCLNTDGKLIASRCFLRHLQEDYKKSIADYLVSLSEVSRYQYNVEEHLASIDFDSGPVQITFDVVDSLGQDAPEAPQSSPTQQEGADTTPPENAPEGPQEPSEEDNTNGN